MQKIKKCLNCGKEFIAKFQRGKFGKFCSTKCHGEHMTKSSTGDQNSFVDVNFDETF